METPLASMAENPVKPSLNNIEELTITIVAKNLNPSMLSPDFLKFSGIIPNEWELAKQPVANPRNSQVNFVNGLNIIAQPGSISFSEAIANKKLSDLNFGKVAQQYIQKLPNAEYQGLSISPKIIVPFPGEGDEERGKTFINDQLLAQGPWRNFGNNPAQAALNLFYQLEKCQLSLNINPARLQQPNDEVTSAVLFAGNFNYGFSNVSQPQILMDLTAKINEWENDFTLFKELIYQKFLQVGIPQETNLFSIS